MSDLKPCPFNLPLRSVDPTSIGSGKGSYPVIVADCEGEFVKGVIGHIRFETSVHSGTSRYMDYSLAKEMADYACKAINQYAEIDKLKAETVIEALSIAMLEVPADGTALELRESLMSFVERKLGRG